MTKLRIIFTIFCILCALAPCRGSDLNKKQASVSMGYTYVNSQNSFGPTLSVDYTSRLFEQVCLGFGVDADYYMNARSFNIPTSSQRFNILNYGVSFVAQYSFARTGSISPIIECRVGAQTSDKSNTDKQMLTYSYGLFGQVGIGIKIKDFTVLTSIRNSWDNTFIYPDNYFKKHIDSRMYIKIRYDIPLHVM